jgi:hypothetical protein
VNDLYNENYKPLKKKNQRGLQKMESSPMFMDWQNQCCENGYITRKKNYMFNAISIKIPMTFITQIEKLTPKFLWKHKRL